LGVKGILIKAAELGYITEVTCGMPKCFCPEELGGAAYFERRTHPGPTGSRPTSTFQSQNETRPEDTREPILAHRLCNKLDYFVSQGLSIEKDLARVEVARKAAAAANVLSDSGQRIQSATTE
jgi:hypothetical protein